MSKTFKAATPLWAKLILVPLVIAADQYVKAWASAALYPDGSREFIPGLVRFVYAENRGAAFGMLQNARWLFVVVTLIAFAGLVWLFAAKKVYGEFGHWALVVVLSGASGNFIDRAGKGYVVDMFEFEFLNFAIFNVADIFVTVGGVLICVYLLFFHEKLRGKEPGASDTQSHDLGDGAQ